MSKGSAPRPMNVDLGKFEKNWDNIFGTARTASEDRVLLICTFPDKNHRCEGCDCWKSKEVSQ